MPEVEPDVCLGKSIVLESVQTILDKIVESLLIKANFEVCVIAVVQDHGLYWANEGLFERFNIYGVHFLFGREDHVGNEAELVVFVVDADVDLRLSESIVSCWIDKLFDFNTLDGLVLGVLDDRDQSVDAAGGQPRVTPVFELVIGAHARLLRFVKLLLKCSDELTVLGVLPFVFLEVSLQSGAEIVLAHYFDDLLQVRGTLAVGDTVEDGLGLGERFDIVTDRMG